MVYFYANIEVPNLNDKWDIILNNKKKHNYLYIKLIVKKVGFKKYNKIFNFEVFQLVIIFHYSIL